VQKLLKESFVSTWSLVLDLQEMEKNVSNSEVAKLANLTLQGYTFPVVSMIALPNGSVIHHINANVLLNDEMTLPESLFGIFDDPIGHKYTLFLEEGLRKATAYL